MLKRRKKSNRKAFSMIELLGVMVIVGIISTIAIVSVSRYFNHAREQKDEQNKNNIIMAAEAYYQSNRDLLPKIMGEASEVYLNDLRKAKYLSADVYNSKEESCMEHSSVRVVKLDDDYYSYLPQLYCGSEKPKDDIHNGPSPVIEDFGFFDTDNKPTEDKASKLTNVKNARFGFTMKGANDNDDIKIYNYSYSIFVKDESTNGEFIEVFNSGYIKGNSRNTIKIKSNPISKYFDVTGRIEIKVRIFVMNEQGMYINYIGGDSTDDNSFEDIDAPLCGDKSGEAQNDEEWTNKSTYNSGSTTADILRGYPRILSVFCDDRSGSGCKRSDFSKSWPTNSKNELGVVKFEYGARWGYVIIEDNAVNVDKDSVDCEKDDRKFKVLEFDDAENENNNVVRYCKNKNSSQNGNQRVCYVRVNVDVQSPTIKVSVLKNGTDVEVASKVVADKEQINDVMPEKTIKSDEYLDTEGVEENEQWLNLTNYPNGIELRAEVTDNLYLYRWTWETSDAYLPFSTPDSEVVNSAIESGRGESNAGKDNDGSLATSGYFEQKAGFNGDVVTSFSQFEANEYGNRKDTITGLKLTLEGKRYGRLTVYDKAGNTSTLHVYANIDRTPPTVPVMSHIKNGATTEKTVYTDSGSKKEKLVYEPTGEVYTPANEEDYADNNHWSRETIKTFIIDNYRKDNLASRYEIYDIELDKGNLSGWWKFIYSYQMQNPDKPKYSWKEAVIGDGKEAISFVDEGTHIVKVRSCDKAKNCSEYSLDDYLKIDYTLPNCGIREDFHNASGYNAKGWLKIGESVTLYHTCNDLKKNISSECNQFSKLNSQHYDYNFDIETTKAGANGFENSLSSTSVDKRNINDERFGDEWYSPEQSVAGGHVVDYAGNVQECPVKTVKIDYIPPNCFTKIEYGVDGKIDKSITPKNPTNPSDLETGWLSLYQGGINQTIANAKKETATVSHDCTDDKSDTSPMFGVHSKCDTSTYRSTVYNWELRTTSAGALGINNGGEIADLAGNISPCPADKKINIDYTQPKCTTIIEYPQGAPINQTTDDIESGWLGYNDNVNCRNGVKDPSYRFGGATSGGSNSGVVDNSSNIKGSGDVRTYSHKAYLDLSKFNPNNTVTREDYAKILCDALEINYDNVSYADKYTDVPKDSAGKWKPIIAATEQGFFSGVGGNRFAPKSILTRAELVSSIMRAATTRAVSTKTCTDVRFTDYDSSAWYAKDLEAAANNCFFVGTGRSGDEVYSSVTSNATIAQIATVIYRAFRQENESSCRTTDNKEFDAKNWSGVTFDSWAKEALADASVAHTCTNGKEASSLVSTTDGPKQFKAYLEGSLLNYTNDLKRKEFIKMLYNAAQIEPTHECNRSSYTDIGNDIYCKYITEAKIDGIMLGTGNNKFSPESKITRAEVITAVLAFMKKHGLSTGKTCNTYIPDLEDKWYAKNMTEAAGMCLLVGDNNGFYRPDEVASVVETAAILYRAFRNHNGLKCTIDGKDYDSVLVQIKNPSGGYVSQDFWGYEYLKNATTNHVCSGTLVDENQSENIVKSGVPDTRCNQKSSEKKTAVVTQRCTELAEFNRGTGQNGIESGCYGSYVGNKAVNKYQSATYNKTMDIKDAGAVGRNDSGYIIDVAGNITNCTTPENLHTVRIDYERPSCRVTSTYVDGRLGQGGDYDGHWMGKNSSATISSFCDSETGGSGCWYEKDTVHVYNSEVKAVNDASSMDKFADAYTYDLAGNMSKTVCEKKTVQIDQSTPSCNEPTIAKYGSGKSLVQSKSGDPTKNYSSTSNMVSGWATGWLDENYTVRVISYCEKDSEIKNTSPKTSDKSGSQCKGAPDIPNGENNQRSWNDYNATGTVINANKGARKLNSVTNSDDSYEHPAFSVSGIKRINFAESILQALGIKYDETSSLPFTDVTNDRYNRIVTAVYKNGLMVGTSATTFAPDKELKRSEMIVAIVRASKSRGISYSNLTCNRDKVFDDYNQFNDTSWFKEEFNYAIRNCIVVGFGKNSAGKENIGPNDIATTQQIATVIDRALRPHEKGYTCKERNGADFLSQKTGGPYWYSDGVTEMKYHKCTRDDKAKVDGERHVVYDNVGNYTTCGDVKIQLDGVAPKCETKSQNSNWVNGSSAPIKVEAACNDTYNSVSGSGCRLNQTGAVITNPPSLTYSGSGWVLMKSRDYPKVSGEVYNKSNTGAWGEGSDVTIYDGVNHSTTCRANATVKIDDEKPTCSITHSGTINSWVKERSVIFYGNCDDKYGSGCVSNNSRTSQEVIKNYGENTNKTYEYASYTAVDAVGNRSTQCQEGPYNVLLDTKAPTASCSYSGYYYSDGNIYNRSTVTVNNYSKDDGNGIGRITYTVDEPNLTDSRYYYCDRNNIYNTKKIKGYIDICDGLNNCQTIECTGEVQIPACCSSGNVSSTWELDGGCYFPSGSCGQKKQDYKKVSNLNSSVICQTKTENGSCPYVSCSTS